MATEVKEEKLILLNPLVHGNLSKEVIQFCEQANEQIKKIRLSFDRPLVPAELFESSEFLLSFRAWLTAHIMEAEARYRDKIEEFRVEGKSVAAAETKAKTTPEYRAYKYLSRVDELAQEQVLLVKKFFSRLDEEFRQGGGL